MKRIRLGPPFTLILAVACVAGTYVPGAGLLGVSGGLRSLLHPLTWLTLFTWPFVHADTAHLTGNLMFFLLLSPGLEKKQGSAEFLFCLGLTAVVAGLGHLAFGGNQTSLIGASGWVFMMIILSTFTTDEPGTVSIPTIVVAVLYGWREIKEAFSPNQVSQLAHALGGLCGLAFGLLGSGQRIRERATSLPVNTIHSPPPS